MKKLRINVQAEVYDHPEGPVTKVQILNIDQPFCHVTEVFSIMEGAQIIKSAKDWKRKKKTVDDPIGDDEDIIVPEEVVDYSHGFILAEIGRSEIKKKHTKQVMPSTPVHFPQKKGSPITFHTRAEMELEMCFDRNPGNGKHSAKHVLRIQPGIDGFVSLGVKNKDAKFKIKDAKETKSKSKGSEEIIRFQKKAKFDLIMEG